MLRFHSRLTTQTNLPISLGIVRGCVQENQRFQGYNAHPLSDQSSVLRFLVSAQNALGRREEDLAVFWGTHFVKTQALLLMFFLLFASIIVVVVVLVLVLVLLVVCIAVVLVIFTVPAGVGVGAGAGAVIHGDDSSM